MIPLLRASWHEIRSLIWLLINFRNALPDKPASDITSTDVANAVAYYMGQTTDLNDEGLAMVQNLAKYICDNSVSEKNSENS